MDWDVAIIGAGAAGLMAAAWAGRKSPGSRIVLFDGAARLGAKILVAGGGRCNVTHYEVDERAYAGSSRNAIRKVLGRFGVPATTEFFRGLGVELKREDTGKLFPTSDDARTVLNALLGAVRSAAVEVRHPARVVGLDRAEDGFVIRFEGAMASVRARRVILATGGMSLPKTGSDGLGYSLAKGVGHTITRDVFPGLVPLLLERNHWLCALSGITIEATLELRSHTGQKLQSFTGSTLLTHVGLSGPSVLDISRYWTRAKIDSVREGTPPPKLVIQWLSGVTAEGLDREMTSMGRQSPLAWTNLRARGQLPERLVEAIVTHTGFSPGTTGAMMTREQRKSLALALTQLEVPIIGDRGYNFAEVTAGGVPLSEVRLETMESRHCPGLYLCGEVCDVDGRIGGFNFQWAWASGFVAGSAAAVA